MSSSFFDAGEHRGKDGVAVGRAENEIHVFGRLFQNFQKFVLRRRVCVLQGVQNVQFAVGFQGFHVRVVDDRPDVAHRDLTSLFRGNDRHVGKSLFADQPVPPLVPARDEHREFL